MSGAVSNHTMRVGIGFVTRLSVFSTRSCDFNLFQQDCRLGREVLPNFHHFCETCFSAYLRQFFCCRSIFVSFSLYLQRRRPFLSAVCGTWRARACFTIPIPSNTHIDVLGFSAALAPLISTVWAAQAMWLGRLRKELVLSCPHVDFPMWTSNFWSFTKETLGE